MPQNLNSYLTTWQKMLENLKPHLTDLPNLADDHAALSSLVGQGLALEGQQDFHKANLREVNQQRRSLTVQGRDLRNRLAAGLKSAFGLENERLIEFGVKPRARTVQKKRLTSADKAKNAAALAAKATAQAEAEAALAAAREQLAKAAVS